MVVELSIVTGARDEVVRLSPVAEKVDMLTLGHDVMMEVLQKVVDNEAVPIDAREAPEEAVIVTISVVSTTVTPFGGRVVRSVPIAMGGGVGTPTMTVVVTCIC
jgi:hypothetical protein